MTERILPKDAILIPEHAKCVFEGKIFSVYQWQQEMYDGSLQTFEMLKRPDSVKILAINDNEMVVALDEQQPGGIKRINSLPGGRVDPTDESALAAAKREVQEETGWSFRQWRLLAITQPQPKIDWLVYLFLAQEPIDKKTTQHDAGENIVIKSISLQQAVASLVKDFPQFASISTLDELLQNTN